jgi:hypothetical protein
MPQFLSCTSCFTLVATREALQLLENPSKHNTYLSSKALFIDVAVINNSWYWNNSKLHALLVMGLGLHVFGQITFCLETAKIKTTQNKCQFLGSFTYVRTFFYLLFRCFSITCVAISTFICDPKFC